MNLQVVPPATPLTSVGVGGCHRTSGRPWRTENTFDFPEPEGFHSATFLKAPSLRPLHAAGPDIFLSNGSQRSLDNPESRRHMKAIQPKTPPPPPPHSKILVFCWEPQMSFAKHLTATGHPYSHDPSVPSVPSYPSGPNDPNDPSIPRVSSTWVLEYYTLMRFLGSGFLSELLVPRKYTFFQGLLHRGSTHWLFQVSPSDPKVPSVPSILHVPRVPRV